MRWARLLFTGFIGLWVLTVLLHTINLIEAIIGTSEPLWSMGVYLGTIGIGWVMVGILLIIYQEFFS